MIPRNSSSVGEELEVLWRSGTLTGMSDAQLVGRFVDARDAMAESAFRELIHRHGPMVMGVCRQILGHRDDADDAFQATFLVLVRKAGSIRVRDSLAPWLYAVAYRTARRLQAIASRYRTTPVENLEDPMGNLAASAEYFDLRPWLHEELNRLPPKYRDPIVLCHLEGKTHEEAARLLCWPVGTVSGRLSRGRELLRSRLKRRGLEVSPAVLAAQWLAGMPAVVAPHLVESTVSAAIGIAGPAISASVLSLTQGVLNAMLFNKIKMAALVVVLVASVAGSVGIWEIRASQGRNGQGQAGKPNPAQDSFKAAVPLSGVQSALKDMRKAFIPLSRQPGAGTGFGLPAPSEEPGAGMGFGIPAVHLKNSPNIDPSRASPGIRTESMVLVQSPDRTAWEGMSLELDRPRWSKIQFRPGLSAHPVVSGDVAALSIWGKTIDQVAAFSPFTGNWVAQMLREPVKDGINPVVGPEWALYQAGNDFYAFSSRRGVWSVLHLEGKEQASVTLSGAAIEVMQGNRLYVFALKHGEWSKPVDVYLPPPTAGPNRAQSQGAQKTPQ
jgi:RNA polymerase sigma factor (sigma-70 family)